MPIFLIGKRILSKLFLVFIRIYPKHPLVSFLGFLLFLSKCEHIVASVNPYIYIPLYFNIMHKKIYLFLIPIFITVACSDKPIFPNAPEIKFLDIQPKVVTEFQDSIIIQLSFTDGDGDLGDDGSSQFNMFVKDNRSSIPPELATIPYILPNLTPDAKNPAIQGVITIEYPPTGILNGLESEMTTFDILVVDRAGNESNTITTEPIEIVK